MELLFLPVKLARWPLKSVFGGLAFVFGVRKTRTYTLPVAGLDEAKAQTILYLLRRAADVPQVRAAGARRGAGPRVQGRGQGRHAEPL